MFYCIIVEILLILETKLQSCQVLTDKLTKLKMSSLWADISTRWYLRLVYCDSSSQNFNSGVDVHVSANVVWERADWDIGVDSSDSLFTHWKKQIDCISKVVLCKCSIAKSVSINFGTSDFVLWQKLWRRTGEQGQFLVWVVHRWELKRCES